MRSVGPNVGGLLRGAFVASRSRGLVRLNLWRRQFNQNYGS